MLVDYVSRTKRSRDLQRCHWTRDLSVASVFLQKRCVNGADGPRRISADFGSPRTIFHQIMGHGSHAWKNLDPGVGAHFRRMNRKLGRFGLLASGETSRPLPWKIPMVSLKYGSEATVNTTE